MTIPEETPIPEEELPAGTPPAEEAASTGASPLDGNMNQSDEGAVPEGFQPLPQSTQLAPARRRRARRGMVTLGNEERSALLARLAHRAFPSFEFFAFALLCGAILGAGYILDSQSLLLLGILLAPLMTPWVGVILAGSTGSWRFFLQAAAGFLVGAALIFGTGLIAGVAARIWLPLPLTQANTHSQLWWPNLFVVVLGAIILTLSFVRSEEKPILASIMLTYELYLPLSAGGFGLGSGLLRVWPDGLLVFLAHLSLATLFGLITLFILKFRPPKAKDYILGSLILLSSLAAMIILSGLATTLFSPIPANISTPTERILPTPSVETTPTETDLPPTPTLPTETPTSQIPPSATPTETATLAPTPVYARIFSASLGGAIVRSEPGGGIVVISLINGYLVEILPESQTVNGVTWVHIYVPDKGLDGWVQQDVVLTATSVP